MVLINYATKEIVAKIVYYGPGLCGKTTNLQHIYTKMNPKKRGKMISLATEADRTLFFDFLPVELGVVQGFKVRFQVYTVPGQVFYGATRRLVLKGADAVVFVADSQTDVVSKNLESIEDMKLNLLENGLDPETIPIIFQWNKRDLPNIIDTASLDEKLNYRHAPNYEASAVTGAGVMETFKGVVSLLIKDLKRKHTLIDSGIKELPPDIFEPKPENPPEAALELELGSSIRENSPESGKNGPESILDKMESITLSDVVQAEVFFDNVRQGKQADEAKLKAQSAGTAGAVDLSDASGEFEIVHESAEPSTEVAGASASPAVAAATRRPDFDIMPLIEHITKLEEMTTALTREVAGLKEKVNSVPEAGPGAAKLEEGIAALSREIAGLKEKKKAAPEVDARAQGELIERKIREAFEGHDQFMLSLLENVRELKKNMSDFNDRVEDALKNLGGGAGSQKRKWF